MYATIEFYIPNNPEKICPMTLTQHFYLVALFHLTLTMAFSQHKAHRYLYATLLNPWEAFFAKCGFTAVISPVSVANKPKSDYFNL